MSKYPTSLNNCKWKKCIKEQIFYNEELTSQSMQANESPPSLLSLSFNLFLSLELFLLRTLPSSPSSAVLCSRHLSLPFAPIHQLSFLCLLLSSKSTTLTHSLKPNKNSRLTFSIPYSHLSLKPLNLIKHIYHTQLFFFFSLSHLQPSFIVLPKTLDC